MRSFERTWWASLATERSIERRGCMAASLRHSEPNSTTEATTPRPRNFTQSTPADYRRRWPCDFRTCGNRLPALAAHEMNADFEAAIWDPVDAGEPAYLSNRKKVESHECKIPNL